MTALTETRTVLPSKSTQQEFATDAEALFTLSRTVTASWKMDNLPVMQACLRELDASAAEITRLNQVVRQAQRPAAKHEISNEIAGLVGCFLNASNKDASVFSLALAQDLHDRRAPIAALIWGFRKVRQTSRFFPTIAEILEAVDAEAQRIRAVAYRLEQLPRLIDETQIRIARQESIERERASKCALPLGDVTRAPRHA